MRFRGRNIWNDVRIRVATVDPAVLDTGADYDHLWGQKNAVSVVLYVRKQDKLIY